MALAPRSYSYPKVLAYAAGILLLWRYVDRPSDRRAVELGVATAIAFYLRHDHGLYLGLVVLAVIAMRHAGAVRAMAQQAAVFAATSEVNQRLNVAALERERPAVAIMEAGRELTDMATHPAVLAYLAANYHELGTLPVSDGTAIRVYGRNDRQSTSTHSGLGWPCYR